MKKTLITLLTLTLTSLISFAAATKKPNVLLIGDSISIGYTPFVIETLKKEANVERIKGNSQSTKEGVIKIKAYLGNKNWSVIHFNYGLHDLCYRNPKSKDKGKRDKLKGTLSSTLEEYETNLQIIVDALKATNAKLIFATTTYVPEGEIGRFPEDLAKYNAVALKVMQRNNIPVNPLFDISTDIHKKYGKGDTKYGAKEGNVHYEEAGSKLFADQVSDYIRQALPAPVCE